MKIIIAGSRKVSKYEIVAAAIHFSGLADDIEEVVSGGAQGVDEYGEEWAEEHDLPIRRFVPEWEKHGRAAGPIRNRQMAQYANGAIIIWDGVSRGTSSMIQEALKARLSRISIHVVTIRP